MIHSQRRIDHLVLAVHDLEAAAALYTKLGFQVGARNRHPWGTENRLVQFGSSFIELITVGQNPETIAPHQPGRVWMPPTLQGISSDFIRSMLASIGRVSGLWSWPAPRGRYAVRRTGSTSVQRAWLARAPGLAYPILNIEVLSASFRQSIFSPGLITPGIPHCRPREAADHAIL